MSRNAFFSSRSEKQKHFFDVFIFGKKQIEMWFSVVCTLIDNDTRHHSGQNVVDSRGAGE